MDDFGIVTLHQLDLGRARGAHVHETKVRPEQTQVVQALE